MALKVTSNQGTPSKTVSEIDLVSDLLVSAETKRNIKRDVGDYLIEKTLQYVADQQSTVTGEKWPKLSKEYSALKNAEGATVAANMELSGDMLNALTYRNTADGVELGFFDSEAWKADGHLKFSGEENHLPQRRFLPAEGQTFKREIASEIESIIADYIGKDADLSKSDFDGVETAADLWRVLSESFEDMSRADIRAIIAGSVDLSELLDDLDLLGFL